MFWAQVKRELQSDNPLVVEFVVNSVIIVPLVLLYKTNVYRLTTYMVKIVNLIFFATVPHLAGLNIGKGWSKVLATRTECWYDNMRYGHIGVQ